MLPEPYYDDGQITIYHADCRDVLPLLGPVDLVLTDPPYGLGERWNGGQGGGKSAWHSSPDEVKAWDGETLDIVCDLPGLATHSIIWGGNYYALPPVRGWLAWDKMQVHSGSDFELAWTNLDIPTRVFRMSRVEAYSRGKFHPTQKPINLFKWCLSFVPDADTILDPFMGSGTTLRAAKDLGRRAIGIEISEEYCAIAVQRLAQQVLPLEAAS